MDEQRAIHQSNREPEVSRLLGSCELLRPDLPGNPKVDLDSPFSSRMIHSGRPDWTTPRIFFRCSSAQSGSLGSSKWGFTLRWFLIVQRGEPQKSVLKQKT